MSLNDEHLKPLVDRLVAILATAKPLDQLKAVEILELRLCEKMLDKNKLIADTIHKHVLQMIDQMAEYRRQNSRQKP
jgi:hypothetical protein